MLNRTGGLDYLTMLTIFNPVILMVDRFIGLLDLRSSDESIEILVDPVQSITISPVVYHFVPHMRKVGVSISKVIIIVGTLYYSL